MIFKLKTYGIDGKLLKLLENYVNDRQQRFVLNGRTSLWKNIYAVVPRDSFSGPLLFVIYINDLPDGLISMCKIFAVDKSLLSKAIDKNNSTSRLNSDLVKISKRAFQWKMPFTPDPNRQAIKAVFSNKHDKENYLPLQFKSTDVQIVDSQKHLILILDSNEHIESEITKCNKMIELMNFNSF